MRIFLTSAGSLVLGAGLVFASQSLAADTGPTFVDQGSMWTMETRNAFYGQDQGSQMIPLPWMRALKQADGSSFLADGLSRYGYLPNPASPDNLPIGFVASGPAPVQVVGMTCSACHTREITVADRSYRIDGGPAIADFQTLLTDLDGAVARILGDPSAFTRFAALVLGPNVPNAADATALHEQVEAWYLRYHTLMSRALPAATPWGPARLDAVGMIFDRLTGLDLGPPPSFLIPENIRVADAPVRYPFLWNAPIQNRTQWPGFAANGNDLLGLSRNLGEVFGVFGRFNPKKENFWHLLRVDYLSMNSANFEGLNTLERLVKKIGKPKWPWATDPVLVAAGKAIFARPNDKGGCAGCHGIVEKRDPFFGNTTWETPILQAGTDTREYDVLAWTAKSGVLEGGDIPFLTKPLAATDKAFNILALSVTGSILQHYVPITQLAVSEPRLSNLFNLTAASKSAAKQTQLKSVPQDLRALQDAFRYPAKAPGETKTAVTNATPTPVNAYESRVMEGIWAAAPYLHNGSVPTLADLLKPAEERPKQFKIGPVYDLEKVGLAAEQTKFDYILRTTDCADLNSGNSRCGHEYGTKTLSADEKKALLEYLKTL